MLAHVLVEWSNRELGEDPDTDMQLRLKVAMCKMRQRLKKHGIEIRTVHSVGYFMDDVSKDRLREMISGTH
jgi:DNA-binding response OmpR family regulator